MRPIAHFGFSAKSKRFTTWDDQARRSLRAGLSGLSAWGIAASLAACLLACTKESDQNLWRREFATSRPVKNTEVGGYWQGDIAMGKVRAKFENAKFTLAIRCDTEGKLVAQGSAPVSVEPGDPSIMTLQSDLQSDSGDEVCGFRFYKGNRFAFALRPGGLLKINFAGTSVTELTKLADLEGNR